MNKHKIAQALLVSFIALFFSGCNFLKGGKDDALTTPKQEKKKEYKITIFDLNFKEILSKTQDSPEIIIDNYIENIIKDYPDMKYAILRANFDDNKYSIFRFDIANKNLQSFNDLLECPTWVTVQDDGAFVFDGLVIYNSDLKKIGRVQATESLLILYNELDQEIDRLNLSENEIKIDAQGYKTIECQSIIARNYQNKGTLYIREFDQTILVIKPEADKVSTLFRIKYHAEENKITIFDSNFNRIAFKMQNNTKIGDDIYDKIRKDYPEMEYAIAIAFNGKFVCRLDIANKSYELIENLIEYPNVENKSEDDNTLITDAILIYNLDFKKIGRVKILFQRKSEILTCIFYDDLGKETDRYGLNSYLELLDNEKAMRLLNAIIGNYESKGILYISDREQNIHIYCGNELLSLFDEHDKPIQLMSSKEEYNKKYKITIFDSNFSKEILSKTQDNAEIGDHIEKIAKDFPDMEYGMVVIECNNKDYIYRLDIKNKSLELIEDMVGHLEEDHHIVEVIYDSNFKKIGKVRFNISKNGPNEFILYNEANEEIHRVYDKYRFTEDAINGMIDRYYGNEQILYRIRDKHLELWRLNSLKKFEAEYRYKNRILIKNPNFDNKKEYKITIFDSNFKELTSKTQDNYEIANDIEKIAKDHPDMAYGMVVIECSNKSYIYRLDIKNKSWELIDHLAEDLNKKYVKEDAFGYAIYNSNFKQIGRVKCVRTTIDKLVDEKCILYNGSDEEIDRVSILYIKGEAISRYQYMMKRMIERYYRDQQIVYRIFCDTNNDIDLLRLNGLKTFTQEYQYKNNILIRNPNFDNKKEYKITIFDSNFSKEILSNTQNNAEIGDHIEKIAKDFPDMEYGMVVIECNNKDYIYRLDIKNKSLELIEDIVGYPNGEYLKEDEKTFIFDFEAIYNSDFKKIGKIKSVKKLADKLLTEKFILYNSSNKEIDRVCVSDKSDKEAMLELNSMIERYYGDQKILYRIRDEYLELWRLNSLKKFDAQYRYINNKLFRLNNITIFDCNFKELISKTKHNAEISNDIYEDIQRLYPEMKYAIIMINFDDKDYIYRLDIKNKTYKPIEDLVEYPDREVLKEDDDTSIKDLEAIYNSDFKKIGRIKWIRKYIKKLVDDQFHTVKLTEELRDDQFILYNDADEEIDRVCIIGSSFDYSNIPEIGSKIHSMIKRNYKDQEMLYRVSSRIGVYQLNAFKYMYKNNKLY